MKELSNGEEVPEMVYNELYEVLQEVKQSNCTVTEGTDRVCQILVTTYKILILNPLKDLTWQKNIMLQQISEDFSNV